MRTISKADFERRKPPAKPASEPPKQPVKNELADAVDQSVRAAVTAAEAAVIAADQVKAVIAATKRRELLRADVKRDSDDLITRIEFVYRA